MDLNDIQKIVYMIKLTKRLSAMIIKNQMRRLSAYIVLVRNPPSMSSYCKLICWQSKAHIILYCLPYLQMRCIAHLSYLLKDCRYEYQRNTQKGISDSLFRTGELRWSL